MNSLRSWIENGTVAFVLATALLQVSCGGKAPEVAKGPAPDSSSNSGSNSGGAPQIEKIQPSNTAVGRGFFVQANGDSAISVTGKGFKRGAKIRLNGQPVFTAFASETGLSGRVSPTIYATAGTVTVTVENPDGQVSNSAGFEVLPVTGPAPTVTKLYPNSTTVGKAINAQPDGSSALGIEGTGFLPGAKVFFGEKALFTAFGSTTGLSASVPPELLKSASTVKVRVTNPDNKNSNVVEFSIKP